MIRSYKDLDVWKESMRAVKEIYLATKELPKDELYGLISQLRRCAVSIPSNIAEGNTRQHTTEYIQFLYIALGSCAELETQIIISGELGYLNKEIEAGLLEKLDYIGRMLRNLIKALRVPNLGVRDSRFGVRAPRLETRDLSLEPRKKIGCKHN